MSNKELPVLVDVVPAPDAPVWTWDNGARFRVTGTSRATGKPVSASKLSGVVSATLTTHSYKPQSTDADRNPLEVTGPALMLSYAPTVITESGKNTGDTGDTAFTVNGRACTSNMFVYLEWESDALRPLPAEYARPRAAFFDEPGHWSLREDAYTKHFTDASRPYALAVALQIAGYLATDETVAALYVKRAEELAIQRRETLHFAARVAEAAERVQTQAECLERAYTIANHRPLAIREVEREEYRNAVLELERLERDHRWRGFR